MPNPSDESKTGISASAGSDPQPAARPEDSGSNNSSSSYTQFSS